MVRTLNFYTIDKRRWIELIETSTGEWHCYEHDIDRGNHDLCSHTDLYDAIVYVVENYPNVHLVGPYPDFL